MSRERERERERESEIVVRCSDHPSVMMKWCSYVGLFQLSLPLDYPLRLESKDDLVAKPNFGVEMQRDSSGNFEIFLSLLQYLIAYASRLRVVIETIVVQSDASIQVNELQFLWEKKISVLLKFQ